MNKKTLSERDICSKVITPALQAAGWDIETIRRADYVLYYKPCIPIAVLEAKDNNHSLRDGIQQALAYAELLDVPFAFFQQRRRLCLA